jgi:hypothetical protein
LRVLIVEDEAIVDATLADIVEEFGGRVAGVVSPGSPLLARRAKSCLM